MGRGRGVGVSINNKAQTKRIFLFMSTHNTHPIQVETNVYVTVGAINYGAMDMDGWMDGLICLFVCLSFCPTVRLRLWRFSVSLSLSGSWCNIIRQAFLSFLSELFIYTSQKCQWTVRNVAGKADSNCHINTGPKVPMSVHGIHANVSIHRGFYFFSLPFPLPFLPSPIFMSCLCVFTLRPNVILKKKFKIELGKRRPNACCKFTL